MKATRINGIWTYYFNGYVLTRKQSEALIEAVIALDVEPMYENAIIGSVLVTDILERAKMIERGEV